MMHNMEKNSNFISFFLYRIRSLQIYIKFESKREAMSVLTSAVQSHGVLMQQ